MGGCRCDQRRSCFRRNVSHLEGYRLLAKITPPRAWLGSNSRSERGETRDSTQGMGHYWRLIRDPFVFRRPQLIANFIHLHAALLISARQAIEAEYPSASIALGQ